MPIDYYTYYNHYNSTSITGVYNRKPILQGYPKDPPKIKSVPLIPDIFKSK